MEVGRRSLSSKNEFRERRSGRKKMGALPLAMVLSFNDKDVHPDCPNVSNPYHKCGRHCLVEIPRGKNFLDALRPDGDQEWEKKSEKTGVNPNCPHASNPYHKCAEYCLEKLSGKLQDAGKDQAATKLRGSKEGEKVVNAKTNTGFHPHCKHASNPNHECAESCFQSVTDGNIAQKEKHKEVSNKANKSSMRLNRNASSHNKVSETCFEDTPKTEHLKGAIKNLKEEDILVLPSERRVNPECKFASNPYHVCAHYCLQNAIESEQHGQALVQSKENKEAVFPLERVNPQCKYASNAYHVCAEYCLQNVHNGRHPERSVMKSREEKKVVTSTLVVDLDSKHLSNPYNVCAEHCSKNVLERDPPQQTIMNLKEEDIVVLPSERRVSPECKFASNPYHVCAEYCLQNAIESEQHGQVMKLKSLKELKNLVSNKKTISGHPQCQYSSNPYHQCAEYCFNKNIPGIKVPNGVMKTSERKNEKRNACRRDENPKYKNASNSFHRCAEYCPEEISLKNEAVEGSTATVEKKKRNSSKENESREPRDVQPLHDSTDLFHEWAKYCSQTKVADQDEVVKHAKKAGTGEYTRRNGKGDCFQNYYGSANMEKRKTKNLKG